MKYTEIVLKEWMYLWKFTTLKQILAFRALYAVSMLIIVLLINDCFDYFWVKATFQLGIGVFADISFQILTTCYSWAKLIFLIAIAKIK